MFTSSVRHTTAVMNNLKPEKNNLTAPSPSDNSKSIQPSFSVVSISADATLANIGSKYDVTNMSSKAMLQMADELRTNGFVDDRKYLELTLVLTPPGEAHDENKPINYLKQYQDQLEFSKLEPRNNQNGYTKILEDLTSILQKINSYKDVST